MAANFANNLEIIKQRASDETVQAILNAEKEDPSIRVEDRDNGQRRFMATTPEGKELTLHSPRAPEGQAERQVASWEEDNDISGPDRLLFVLGLGAGFHLPPLLKRLNKKAVLVVVDPDPRAVYDILFYSDLRFLIDTSVTVRFISSYNHEQIYRETGRMVGANVRRKAACFVHPALLRLQGDKYKEIASHLGENLRAGETNRKTLAFLSRKWLSNGFGNLVKLPYTTPVESFECLFDGMPAAVVAAGPSLDETMSLLSSIRNRVVVIAVGSAYKPLRRAGIVPDFVIVVDGKDKIAKQFEGVDTTGTVLLAPPQVTPEVYDKFDIERIVTFSTKGLPSFEACLQEWHMGAAELRLSGTVTVSALYAAAFFGCRDIFTFGLDLACREDRVSHASNSLQEETRRNVASGDDIEWTPGNIADVVPAPSALRIYIPLIARFAAEVAEIMNTTITNVNPGGAKIENTVHCLPQDLIVDTPEIRAYVQARIEEALKSPPRGDVDQLWSQIERARQELMQLKCEAERAESLCRELSGKKKLNDKHKNTKLTQLKKVEKSISQKDIAKLLVDGALQRSKIHTLNAFMHIDPDADQEEKEDQEFQQVHRKTAKFYKLAGKAAEWCRDHLADVSEKLAEEDRTTSSSEEKEKTVNETVM